MSAFNLSRLTGKKKKRFKGHLRRFFRRNRSPILIGATLLAIILVGFWSISGFHIGIYHFVPWWKEVGLGLDLRGGVYADYQIIEESATASEISSLTDVIRQRLFSEGYSEAIVTMQGTDRIRVEIPEVSDPSQVSKLIGTPGKLEFKDPDGNVIMTGEDIQNAQPGYGEGNAPVVAFKLKSSGKEKFAAATQKFLGD
ncbi:MAG TPA: hypothetical protein PLZ84_02450, partial [Clostridia bacterium]|nr:hypothetical protein [Clostridia bacterium]